MHVHFAIIYVLIQVHVSLMRLIKLFSILIHLHALHLAQLPMLVPPKHAILIFLVFLLDYNVQSTPSNHFLITWLLIDTISSFLNGVLYLCGAFLSNAGFVTIKVVEPVCPTHYLVLFVDNVT